ncbi:DUF3592 domain-containing protein [Breznakiellaceae bacterium SP9]
MDMNWGAFWGGFVGFAFAVGTGFGLAYFIRQGAKMKRYITTEGTLLSAAITSYTKSSTHDRRTYTYYKPLMKYTYTVDGKEYTRASVIFGGGEYASTSRRDIEKIIDHPVGGPITVFYNPDKPSQSFLDKKASSNLSIMVGLAVFTILFGAIGILTMVAGITGIMG